MHRLPPVDLVPKPAHKAHDRADRAFRKGVLARSLRVDRHKPPGAIASQQVHILLGYSVNGWVYFHPEGSSTYTPASFAFVCNDSQDDVTYRTGEWVHQ